MAPDLADHAYAHCAAVLIHPAMAEDAGREALRRGGRTLTGVLAHTRHVALSGSPAAGPADVDPPVELGGAPLTDVARWLSATRPPIERAIVDLQGRHGLDRVRFARCLGLSPTAAAIRAAAVAEIWAAALDPALLARLGPGQCDELGRLLAAQGLAPTDHLDEGEQDDGMGLPEPAAAADRDGGRPVTVDMLLASVPAMSAHVQDCERCRDRCRAMVSVQDLVVGIPLETAPASVRVVRRDTGRSRRAAPLPPPIVPDVPRRPWRRAVVAGAVVSALAVVLAGGAALAERARHSRQTDRVQALTKLPATNALSVDPTSILLPGGAFALTNLSGRTVHWEAASPVPWLSLDPASGTLGPHSQTQLRARLGPAAPGGLASATIAVTGDDGSATAVGVSTSGAGSTDLAASVNGCTITASAEAPQGIAGVVLHWLARPAGAVSSPPGREHVITMVRGDTGYTATLPPAPSPIQWWVTAADADGNQAQTARQILPPGSCG
jgi:hypothetical protein